MSKFRYDDKELSLIKNTFSDNLSVLKLLRKVFLQAKLSKEDINKLSKISDSADLLFLLKKTYAPEIEVDAPLGQVVDLWLTIDTKGLSPNDVNLALKVRSRLKELISLGLQRLEKPKEKGVVEIVDYTPDFSMNSEDLYVEYTARNALISHTEFQLNQLNILAGEKQESVEETKMRLLKNSTK